MKRCYEFLRVGESFRQVLRNAIKTLLKRKNVCKKRIKTNERYATGKGAVKLNVLRNYGMVPKIKINTQIRYVGCATYWPFFATKIS